MFDEFVRLELAATCKRLTNSFYHLDGIGALPHLDSLLSIPELSGIQWVPGDRQKPCSEWTDVYRRILAGGKVAQHIGSPDGFDRLVNALGSGKGLLATAWLPAEKRDDALRFLERHGVAE